MMSICLCRAWQLSQNINIGVAYRKKAAAKDQFETATRSKHGAIRRKMYSKERAMATKQQTVIFKHKERDVDKATTYKN